MEHRHLLAMRWADIDLMRHVNNANYLVYAFEASETLAEQQCLLPIATPRRITVEYLRPMAFGQEDVVVESSMNDAVLTQTIGRNDEVHARVRMEFGSRRLQDPVGVASVSVNLPLRRDDVGSDDMVTLPRLVLLVQEARVSLLNALLGVDRGGLVTASLDLWLGEPLQRASGAVRARSGVVRLGRSSFDIRCDLGAHASATSIVVGFDADTQRSRPLTDDERAALEVDTLARGR